MNRFLAALLAGLALCGAALAKPIELVVPIAPGGSADAMARLIADELAKKMGEPVVVLNKSGGGNTVAARYVLEQPADGRTLMFGTAVLSVVPFENPVPFDYKALVPLTGVYDTPSVLFVRASLPVHDMREFLAWAHGNAKGVAFGSTGVGSMTHIDAESLAAAGDFNMVHVPYAGSSQTFMAMAGDHIDAAFGSPAMIAQAGKQGGKVRPVMVGSDHPLAAAPEVPGVDKSLLGDFHSSNWAAIFVNAATPTPVQQKLSRELQAVLALPAVRERFAHFLLQPVGGTQAEFEAFLQKDRARIGKLLRERGIKLQ